jgi:acetylornithine deacetylase
MKEATPIQADEAAIVAAAHALRAEAVTMLSELVTHPSLLGHEQSAQAFMADAFGASACRWTSSRSTRRS